MPLKVLVCGYYKQPPNLGDHLFTHAFKHLFPHFDFQFTDRITVELLRDIGIVIFGGGSQLDGAPAVKPDALKILQTKIIFYIGVGAETNIHPIHQQLMALAKLVAIRSQHLDKVKVINPNTIVIPDLVYSLIDQVVKSPKIPKSILFLPNILVVPKWNDPYWKHVAFQRFQLEVSQTLDKLIEDGYTIRFAPMSSIATQNDDWASIAIINQMKKHISLDAPNYDDVSSITQYFSQFDLIITQRYHGAVLAEMSGVPYVCLFHHDKLRHSSFDLGSFLSYYEVSKENLLREINIQLQNTSNLLIDPHIFEQLVHMVDQCSDMPQ